MKSMVSMSIAVAAMLAGTCAATNPSLLSLIVSRQSSDSLAYQGCYSSPGSLTFNGTAIWQSKKTCFGLCSPLGYAVEATTNSSSCWCGNAVPPNKVPDSQCNMNCTGYPQELCGGASTFSVYLTGVGKQDVSSSSAAPTTSATTSSSPSVVTIGGQTVVVTTAPTASSASNSSSNKAAIAAGVVVGLVVFAAAAGGGAFLYMRRRRNRLVEEEYRKNAAISEFVAGGKSNTRSSVSHSDTRLDPMVMAQRRMSDGSIADNQDYSRRILKVTNA